MADTATLPIRLSAELVQQAEQEAAVRHRSIAGQVEYWARLGQSMEAAPGYTLDRVKMALAGHFDAAQLDPAERVYFDECLGDALGTPTAEERAFFEARRNAGVGVGYDDQGQLIRARPNGGVEALKDNKAR